MNPTESDETDNQETPMTVTAETTASVVSLASRRGGGQAAEPAESTPKASKKKATTNKKVTKKQTSRGNDVTVEDAKTGPLTADQMAQHTADSSAKFARENPDVQDAGPEDDPEVQARVAAFKAKRPGRQTFNVEDGTFEELVRKLMGLLKGTGSSRVYMMDGELVRLRVYGTEEEPRLVIRPFKVGDLSAEASLNIDFYKIVKKKPKSVRPPHALLQMVLNRGKSMDRTDPAHWQFPELTGIIHVPKLRRDGTILDKPGYDEKTGLYLDLLGQDFKMNPVPEKPTKKDAIAARNYLLDLLCDYPFVDEASRANTLGFFLTAVMRDFIKGPTPLFVVDASSAGSGKSNLLKAAAIVTTGQSAALLVMPESEAELRKSLTANLVEGASYIFWDNVNTLVQSDVLAALLTGDTHRDRRLNYTQMLSIAVRVFWAMNGNNIRISGDIPRRVYYTRLVPKVERPWRRPDSMFTHGEFISYVEQNRAEILRSLLVLARYWVVRGKKPGVKGGVDALAGSFGNWAKTIGGVLEAVDITAFLDNYDQVDNITVSGKDEWGGFFRWWVKEKGTEKVTASELIQTISKHGDAVYPILPESIDAAGDNAKKMGNALAREIGTRADGLVLEQVGKNRIGVSLWRVLIVDKEAYEAAVKEAEARPE